MTMETERAISMVLGGILGFALSRGIIHDSATWVGVAVLALALLVFLWRWSDL